MKRVLILGATGSIGRQALDVIARHPWEFSVAGLSCGRNVALLREQLRALGAGAARHKQSGAVRQEAAAGQSLSAVRQEATAGQSLSAAKGPGPGPEAVCVELEADALILQREFPSLHVMWGSQGLVELAASLDCDLVLNGLMGMRGLAPTCAAVEAGRDVALANKETLVAGGALVMDAVAAKGVRLLPVDSEHSAIFQCLQGQDRGGLQRILLTASGGPFRGWSLEQLAEVMPEQALRHPKWSMGNKITIDSATLMNKGLEVIEACWLFDVTPEQIQVVVHPESIVHSMVEFRDRSVLAQMGVPDMRGPIAYALAYPRRMEDPLVEPVDFFALKELHFEAPDLSVFRCLELACQAFQAGSGATVALNAANEVLVQQFLEKRIKFTEIQNTIERVLSAALPTGKLSLEEILGLDRQVRESLMRSVRAGSA